MTDNRIVRSLLAVLLVLASGLGAQGFEASLRPVADIALAGETAGLVLTLDVKQRVDVPAVLISGLDLQTTLDGKRGPKVSERATGKVTLLAGTRLERTIEIDLKRFDSNLKKGGLTRVTFEWVGLQGVAATVSVAPNLRDIAVEDLDLARTRVLLVTNLGEMQLKFHPDKAPNHVKNFVKLSKDGFYDGTRFHRVMSGFMIQGGCPNTRPGATGRPGDGGPGYTVKAEFNDTRHGRGILSMARASDPDSAGCQFFIVHAPSNFLDGKYTAFGELVSGEETLDKIASVPVVGPQKSTPKDPVIIKAAIVQPVFNKK